MYQNEGGGTVIAIVYLIILIGFIAGMWKVFEKAGKPGWAAIVPIYNLVVLLDILGKPIWWLIVIILVPIVNIIMMILLNFALVDKFGKPSSHKILMFFFPMFYYPYLGFSDAQIQG